MCVKVEDKMKSKHKFINDLFVTCDKCGYHNFKDRFQAFGTCLGCGKILDERIYFKAKLKRSKKFNVIEKH